MFFKRPPCGSETSTECESEEQRIVIEPFPGEKDGFKAGWFDPYHTDSVHQPFLSSVTLWPIMMIYCCELIRVFTLTNYSGIMLANAYNIFKISRIK